MTLSRRDMLASLLAASAGLCAEARAAVTRFLIVTASREGAHATAIEGIQSVFAPHSVASELFQLPADDPAMRLALRTGTAQLAIAVGVDALRAVTSVNGRVPIFATMCFETDAGEGSADLKLAGAVWLEMPLASIVGGVRVVLPEASRFAVVQSRPRSSAAVAAERAHHPLPAGVDLQTVECTNPSDLLSTLRKLRGRADCVVCLPDSNLFNKTTIEPLILASIEHKLPLVGYSASFVRAGAAVGVYPDFGDVGRQTAGLAERIAGKPPMPHGEHPRQTSIAVNERVLRLLGRNYRPQSAAEVLIVK